MLTIDTGIKTDGIACGTAFLYRPSMAISRYIPSGSSKEECKRFHLALKQVKSRLSDLAEQEEIFAARSEMADDPMLSEEVETKITAEGLPADKAVEEACDSICTMLSMIDDEYLRSRTDDVRDVCRQIINALPAVCSEENNGLSRSEAISTTDVGTTGKAGPADDGACGRTGTPDTPETGTGIGKATGTETGTGIGTETGTETGTGTGKETGTETGTKTGTGTGISRELPEGTIIVAEELAPSDTARMDFNRLAGLVTEKGSITSHVCIIARNKGIAAMTGVRDCMSRIHDGDCIIIDGPGAKVIVNPDGTVLRSYRELFAHYAETRSAAARSSHEPAVTLDGKRIYVEGNAGNVNDVRTAIEAGADGIGLLRSEFLYMESSDFPDEETQYSAYRAAAEACGDRPLTIRTLDIGGDKKLPYLDIGNEDNPFLGWRAIRISLDRREMFRAQLRAILRASAYGNVRIMFPMITTLEELRQAKKELEFCRKSLTAEGLASDPDIKTGVMIETPAAVMIADMLAAECDFFSIGTNDLTQYIMAADRGNPKVASLYNSLDTAVLRCISHVIEEGHKAGIDVAMCGEMASDPEAIGFLLDSGLEIFSVNASATGDVKARIRQYKSTGQ